MVLDGGSYVREAAPGETGTIAITGPNLFEGYLNDAHNRGLWIDVPGSPSRWLNTGDLGRVDGEGYVWLTGRSKELIIRGGHNIDPKMIEEPMHEHPERGSGRGGRAARCACGRSPRRVCAAAPRHERHRRRAAPVGTRAHRRARGVAESRWWCCRPCRPRPSASSSSPALVEMEVRSVVAEEAQAADATLTSCEVLRDPQKGLVVRWGAERNGDALAQRLARFTFRAERA